MRFKKPIIFISLIFLGIVSLSIFLFINIPSLVEFQLKKIQSNFLKLDNLDFSIQKVGFSNVYISKIRISKDLLIDSISMDFKIKSLKQIEVGKITISGLNLEAHVDKFHGFHIKGLSFPESTKSESNEKEFSFLQFLPERIIINNSRVILKTVDEAFLIPFETISIFRAEEKKIMIQTMVHPFGETVISNLTYDFIKGLEWARIEGKSFDLDHLGPYIPKNINELKLNGAVDFRLESLSPEKEWNLYVSGLSPFSTVSMALEEINARVKIDEHIITAGGTLRVIHPLLSANEFKYDLKINTEKGSSSEIYINTGPVTVKNDELSVFFPEIMILGNIAIDENHIPKSHILMKSSKGKIQSIRYKILASDVSFEIPIGFPDMKKTTMGKFSLPFVIYNNQYHFSTNGTILQSDAKKFEINGKVLSKTLPAVRTQFKTSLDLENNINASVEFETNLFKLKYSDIKKIVSKKQTPFEFDLLASANGSMNYSDRQLKTFMQMNIVDSSIHLPELDLTAKGINTRIDFNDFLVPETVPGQILTIQSIEIKKIRVNETKIQFSLEDAKSLLIENIRFNWCNGLISSESIRFPQKKNEYHLTLFCDRLELTELLKQMGVFHAEGDGTLNGRIPIIYQEGKIAFNNGFLFSSPGSHGKIVIQNTDRLIAGIPKDSPEFSQLDVAREALKNFNYEWAKLTLNTQGDTLTVNMELDGKPAGLLPFEYKKELGGFVRIDASSPGSHFQGIKLDVNLKLPFNDVMKFGNQLNAILN